MKFLAFPYVVQRRVFENMKLEELLFWSFCSKRFKYLIQSIQNYRFKKTKHIRYLFFFDDWVMIHATSSDSNTVFSLNVDSKSRYDCLVNIDIARYEKQDIIPMKLFEMERDVLCCLSDPKKYSSLYIHNDNEKQYVIEGIHTYLYQFFGSSIGYELETTGTERLPVLKNINRSYYELFKNQSTEELEACLAASPNQELISISRNFKGKLSKSSVIHGTRILRIQDCNHVNDILFNFRGERLIIQDKTLPEATIIRFLNEWKLNRRFQNLKSLSIFAAHIGLDAVKMKQIFDIKQSEDYIEFTWKEGCMRGKREEIEWMYRTSTTRDYLIRDKDGLRASIEISPPFFTFVLLSSTES